jgi:hypothetical protein
MDMTFDIKLFDRPKTEAEEGGEEDEVFEFYGYNNGYSSTDIDDLESLVQVGLNNFIDHIKSGEVEVTPESFVEVDIQALIRQ